MICHFNQHRRSLRQSRELVIPALAFIIPVLIRTVPEILMGEYLVGFDPIGYYVPNTITWLNNGVSLSSLLSSAPLIYLLLMGVISTGASVIISLKILAPLLLGFLGLAIYFYAFRGLGWSPKKSLLVALVATLYFVALRISWDMLRSELALIFLFLALILVQSGKWRFRDGLLLSLTMLLVVLSHQLIAVIMFAILAVTLAVFALKKNKAEVYRIIASAVPATAFMLLIVYINYFVYSSPVLGYSINYSGGFEALSSISHTELIVDILGFLAFCYLPLIPLIILGAKHFKNKIHINAWIAWVFVPLLIAIITPSGLFIGGVLPYRWTILLTFPLSFYAVEGLYAIKWKWGRIAVGLAVGALLATLSVSFMVLPNNEAFTYYGTYTTYVPKSMLQNTLQLSDCKDTTNALLWTKNNMPPGGRLMVHEAFYGWGALALGSERLAPYFFENLTLVTNRLQQDNSTDLLYLIWWVNGSGWYDQPTVPAVYGEIYRSGNIAIYKYNNP
ncbi:MAG: hypothetical protein NWE98_07030 [Candidatus Bathyarchaeota archaeon]|nr:hypothetical protein [Candidatus Bathyarchaeota archaeon]